MSEIVVDASVVVKWFIPERHHEQAVSLLDAYVEGSVETVAPAHLPFEVANALVYSDLLDDATVETCMDAFAAFDIDLYRFEHIDGTVETSVSAGVTMYDAAYVALASQRNCQCYTADERLIDALADDSPATHIGAFEA